MTKKTKTEDNQNYQAQRRQLDELLQKLQDPDCDVDEAVDLYERALALAAQLETHLQTAENRVQKVQAGFGVATPDAGTDD